VTAMSGAKIVMLAVW